MNFNNLKTRIYFNLEEKYGKMRTKSSEFKNEVFKEFTLTACSKYLKELLYNDKSFYLVINRVNSYSKKQQQLKNT